MWWSEKTLLTEIRQLRREIEELRGRKEGVRQELVLSDEVVALKKQLVDLKIEKSKLTEEHEKEDRELRHMIGLEKKRQEFEIQQSKREATVTVREENLAADRKRFEDQMEFHDKRFTSEVAYLKDLMGEILERLPTVHVEKRK